MNRNIYIYIRRYSSCVWVGEAQGNARKPGLNPQLRPGPLIQRRLIWPRGLQEVWPVAGRGQSGSGFEARPPSFLVQQLCMGREGAGQRKKTGP